MGVSAVRQFLDRRPRMYGEEAALHGNLVQLVEDGVEMGRFDMFKDIDATH